MIDTLHLFPKLNSSLIRILSELSPRQWNNDTLCKKWTIKDIAAHLLDGALRRLSAGRDAYPAGAPDIRSYKELLSYLNDLNSDWVKAYRRVSPLILTEQLRSVQEQLYEYLKSLDPDGIALFPVSWAGEKISSNRFDIAREYTERWLHQQQIRQAAGAESILERELYHPFLQTCMQALAFHYQGIRGSPGTLIQVEIVGEAGGIWSVIRGEQKWEFTDTDRQADSQVFIDQNIAWMLFSKGIDIREAGQYWQVTGNEELGRHALTMRAFMV